MREEMDTFYVTAVNEKKHILTASLLYKWDLLIFVVCSQVLDGKGAEIYLSKCPISVKKDSVSICRLENNLKLFSLTIFRFPPHSLPHLQRGAVRQLRLRLHRRHRLRRVHRGHSEVRLFFSFKQTILYNSKCVLFLAQDRRVLHQEGVRGQERPRIRDVRAGVNKRSPVVVVVVVVAGGGGAAVSVVVFDDDDDVAANNNNNNILAWAAIISLSLF